MPDIDPVALQKLDAPTRQEIAQWMEAETSKSKVQSSIHNFTDMCWKKCVTHVASANLDAKEEACMRNCLHRFLDTNISIVKQIQQAQR
uniref:Mitochondrial import inner membrane translocase subunit n=1 Tax=Blastobotrys adeninivorans TaxID=409370 RepID=A0A060T452_BLAAD